MGLSFHQQPGTGRNVTWYQCWLECRTRELASLIPSPTYHQARPFQGGTCKKPPADEQMTKASSVLHSQTRSACIGFLVSSPSLNSGICCHLLELLFLLLPQDTLVMSGAFGWCSCPYLAVRGCDVWVICTKDTHSLQEISGLQHTCGFRLFKVHCTLNPNSGSFGGSSGIGRT